MSSQLSVTLDANGTDGDMIRCFFNSDHTVRRTAYHTHLNRCSRFRALRRGEDYYVCKFNTLHFAWERSAMVQHELDCPDRMIGQDLKMAMREMFVEFGYSGSGMPKGKLDQLPEKYRLPIRKGVEKPLEDVHPKAEAADGYESDVGRQLLEREAKKRAEKLRQEKEEKERRNQWEKKQRMEKEEEEQRRKAWNAQQRKEQEEELMPVKCPVEKQRAETKRPDGNYTEKTVKSDKVKEFPTTRVHHLQGQCGDDAERYYHAEFIIKMLRNLEWLKETGERQLNDKETELLEQKKSIFYRFYHRGNRI